MNRWLPTVILQEKWNQWIDYIYEKHFKDISFCVICVVVFPQEPWNWNPLPFSLTYTILHSVQLCKLLTGLGKEIIIPLAVGHSFHTTLMFNSVNTTRQFLTPKSIFISQKTLRTNQSTREVKLEILPNWKTEQDLHVCSRVLLKFVWFKNSLVRIPFIFI